MSKDINGGRGNSKKALMIKSYLHFTLFVYPMELDLAVYNYKCKSLIVELCAIDKSKPKTGWNGQKYLLISNYRLKSDSMKRGTAKKI